MFVAPIVDQVHVITTYLTGSVALVADGHAPQVTWTMVVNFVVGVVAPIAIALINKGHQVKLKAVELAVVSAIVGVLNDWLVSSGSFQWGQALWNAMVVFVIAVASIFGFWEPTGVSDKVRNAGRK